MAPHESLGALGDETCPVTVSNNYTSRPCGRKVKAEGLCGIHLAARNRRRANDAKHREKQERADALNAEAETLTKALGVKVKADYSTFSGGYTGDFVVSGEWLRGQVSE